MTKSEAERQIAAILQQFETATGQLVRDVRIVSLDITEIQDDKQQILSQVRLELEPIRGRRWSK